MKIEIKQLKKIINEVLTEVSSYPKSVGHLYANIAGDSRYSDTLNIEYNPTDDTVTVSINSGSPSGGMDSFAPTASSKDFTRTVPATAKDVMPVIKRIISNDQWLFKQYGKPTKKFRWNNNSLVGLNMSNLASAIANAKGQEF